MVQNGHNGPTELALLRAETQLASEMLAGQQDRRAMELISYAVSDLADLIDSGAPPAVTTEGARLILAPLRQSEAKNPDSVFLKRSVEKIFWLGAFASADRVVSDLRAISRHISRYVVPQSIEHPIPTTALMAQTDAITVQQSPKERALILKQALRDLHLEVNGHPTTQRLENRRHALVVGGPDTRSRVLLTTAIDDAVEYLQSPSDGSDDAWPVLRDAINSAIKGADREFFSRGELQHSMA